MYSTNNKKNQLFILRVCRYIKHLYNMYMIVELAQNITLVLKLCGSI